jgi:Domain of unknown function (DUF4936)
MRTVYLYYRVRRENVASLRTKANAMQAQLASRHGITAFLKRSERRAGAVEEALETWMEVYPDLPADREAIVEQAIVEAGLAALIEGERRKEVFEDMSRCV